MKKNGFTLVELTCVIMLLSIVITLSVVASINIINNSKERKNKSAMSLIETASYEYIIKHENDYALKNNSIYCLPITNLINDDLLISNITYDNKDITDKVIKVIYNDNKYSYTIDEPELCSLVETHEYVITNLIENGGFEDGKNGWIIASTFDSEIANETKISGNNSIKLTVNSQFTSNNQIYFLLNSQTNHQYYFSAYTNTNAVSTDSLTRITFSPGESWAWLKYSQSTTQYKDVWKKHSVLYNNESYSSLKARIAFGGNPSGTTIGDYYFVDDVIVVDLTETFGAGNEPSKEWCDDNITYFDGTTKIYK